MFYELGVQQMMKQLTAFFLLLIVSAAAHADIRTYGFDDGTYQGWEFVDTFYRGPVGWSSGFRNVMENFDGGSRPG